MRAANVMYDISSVRCIALACAACVLAACSHGASTDAHGSATSASASSTQAAWIANGATACDTYLTPAVVADILKNPTGRTKQLSAWSCAYKTTDFANISITLTPAGTAGLDRHIGFLPDPTPLAGVGDKAVRTSLGIEAAKGTDRMCSIDITPPFAAKQSGEAPAQKLGPICNALFALP